ncbi:MAG: branched-chain amino acid aminotransferase [Firmicutes bacterium]|nr:branched-chain amino acid aminotransferase [Bacillota bacterium]
MKYDFPVTLTKNPKQKPESKGLRFGTVMTDHMFIMDYTDEKGWHDGRIVPYGPISLDPAAVVFHYGQEMFEGLKAYETAEGRVQLFRPDMNAKRTNNTNDRLCIPPIDEELFVEAVKAIVKVDKDWIPKGEGTALYIRPFIIATEPFLGVRRATEYKFMIILSPVGPYFVNGLAPTKMYVEDEYVRAVKGGTGEAKCGGNYAASLKAQEIAHEKGYEQILWLDGIHRKYIEEIGAANAFFVIGDEVVTSELNGSILPGITRNSIIALCKHKGYKVSERKISIDELEEAYKAGQLKEMFASGTAAIVSPVGELLYKGERMIINNNEIGPIAQEMYDTIYGIQTGKIEDFMGWTVPVE